MGDEIAQLLHPFVLDVLARRDDEGAEVGLVVAEQGKRPERDVGLTHADLVRQVSDAALGQDVMNRYRPFELLLRALPLADARAEVEEPGGCHHVDHGRASGGTARRRNQRSNQARKSVISPCCRSTSLRRMAARF